MRLVTVSVALLLGVGLVAHATGETSTSLPDSGPAPGVRTLEDIYGPSGESFQAALGFRVFEGNTTQGSAQTGYGIAIDDMVVSWREYRLGSDQTSCATSGSCATVEIDTTNVFDGDGLLTITVTDSSPYRCLGGPPCTPEGKNDCNHNGSFADPGDDGDCNDNGTPDVLVRVTSEVEPAGEWVILDRVGASSSYRGSLPISIGGNVAGVLFVSDTGSLLSSDIVVRYADDWDGRTTGDRCENDPDPAKWGFVNQGVNLALLGDTGSVAITSFRVDDTIPQTGGGASDGDGYPDTNELVDLYVTVSNKTHRNLTHLVAQASVDDPKIECLMVSISTLPALADGAVVELPVPFRLKVSATADRAGAGKTPADDYSALLTISFSADQFALNSSPQRVALDLDLDAQSPVQSTTSFTEGFESGFGNFTFMNLDVNIASNSASDGMRCQYNDPDFINSNSYGYNDECYLGFRSGQVPLNAWHVHGSASPDGGRAYLGNQSVHYGVHTPGNPNLDSYQTSQMDAIRTKSNVNLAARVCTQLQGGQQKSCNSATDCTSPASACVSASPLLSFKHQISLVDSRATSTPIGQSADRAVIQALVANGTTWQKLVPYQNIYDVQGTDFFSNCMFDPTDDGNDEDSYFDPTDPARRLGPSSTCYPEFVFAYLGDTSLVPAGVNKIGRASDGPGLQGSIGPGTWVESRVDLTRYRGRSIRLRYLLTSINLGDAAPTWEGFARWNPTPVDDGWYVDDVRITQTLGASSPTVTNDTQNHGNTSCGAACSSLVVALAAAPPSSTTPGGAVTLTASVAADRCANGVLLHQFWLDVNTNGAIDPGTDMLLRNFATNPVFEVSPATATGYLVRSKCSSAVSPPCDAQDAGVIVTVLAANQSPFFPWARLAFSNKTTLTWTADSSGVEVIRGNLAALLTNGGNLNPTVQSCLANDVTGATATDPAVPAVNGPFYYLARRSVADTTWSTYSPQEIPGAGGTRDADLDGPPRAPNTCAAPP